MILAVSVIAGLATAILLFKFFFDDFDDFVESIKYYFQPDIISIFRDEWFEDMWATRKLVAWFLLSCLAGSGVFYLLQK